MNALWRLLRAVRLALVFGYELVVSALEVTVEILRPRPRRRPEVVVLPLAARSDVEIALLASMITLTPGTLALDLTEDRCGLLVHALFAHEPGRVIERIQRTLERPLLEVLR
jgi:multicomponent Na+:H+ antiporter subunit E